MDWTALLKDVAAGKAVQTDSRRVKAGDVFVALPAAGASASGGEAYIVQALANGATAVVTGPDVPRSAGIPEGAVVSRPDIKAALAELAQAAYGTPRHGIQLVGITGTNGKTTITYVLEHLFAAAGRRVGVLGTVSYRWPGHSEDAPLTTPDCLNLHKYLAQMAAAGVDTAFMEVSSHALEQRRVEGLTFDAAVLTNVTQDHLDYHGDMERYFASKVRLFEQCPKAGKAWVVNADNAYGRRLMNHSNLIAYGLQGGDGVPAGHFLGGKIIEMSAAGMTLSMTWKNQSITIRSQLVGRHNAENLLAATGAALGLGMELSAAKALEDFSGVPGRLERVGNDRGLNVFVDYAHTPDALENVLSAVKALGVKKLIAVFGCGGNRDRAKRPLMAQAVCRHADVAVLTSDNPRHEDPLAIIADAQVGLAQCTETIIEPDRRKAIARALEAAGPDDAVVVAGKGHETYQQVGDVRLPFSDVQVVRELLGGNP